MFLGTLPCTLMNLQPETQCLSPSIFANRAPKYLTWCEIEDNSIQSTLLLKVPPPRASTDKIFCNYRLTTCGCGYITTMTWLTSCNVSLLLIIGDPSTSPTSAQTQCECVASCWWALCSSKNEPHTYPLVCKNKHNPTLVVVMGTQTSKHGKEQAFPLVPNTAHYCFSHCTQILHMG